MSDEIVRRDTMVPGVAASSLARSVPDEDLAVHEFLAFTLANEHYALPLRTVQEILKVPPITEVPRAASDVLGIISVRGRVTTVLDMRKRLRMPELPPSKENRVLLVDDGAEVLGVLVDAVLQVYRLREDEVEMAAAVGPDTADYVMGIGRPRGARTLGRVTAQTLGSGREDEILILLDPRPLLRS